MPKPRADIDGEVVSVRKGPRGPVVTIKTADRELHISLDPRTAALLMGIEPYLRPFQSPVAAGKPHFEG